jgi:hypothetical protein
MRPIPYNIKTEIFLKYLEGDSLPQISDLYNVSVGAVFAITTEEIKQDKDFRFFREIAKVIKKNNLNVYNLIPAIHLYFKIMELGLSSEFFEKFLESADTTSFRLNMNIDEFLDIIKEIINFEKSTQTKIHDILTRIENEKNQLDELGREKEMIEKEINNLSGDIGFLKSQILEYIKQKPLFVRFKENTDTFFKSLDWTTYPYLFEKASNELGRSIDSMILYNKLLSIYTNPHKNAELIRIILDYNSISSDSKRI